MNQLNTLMLDNTIRVDAELLGRLLKRAYAEGFKNRHEIQYSTWCDMIEDNNNLQDIVDEMYDASSIRRDEQKIIESLDASISVKAAFK